MNFRRLLYLGYYFKNQDNAKFTKALYFASRETGRHRFSIFLSTIVDSLRYNISPLESLQFEFYKKSVDEKSTWAGTGFMYEYQKIMNPNQQRHILDDKTIFYKKYQKYFLHDALDLNDMEVHLDVVQKMLQMPKVVLKESRGKCGLGTAFVDSEKFTPQSLIAYMREHGYDLAETYVRQHTDLHALSPSAVNTVRIFTQLNYKGEVEILGCRQRISINSEVDNLAAGNIAAPIDEKTGVVIGAGVYSDPTREAEEIHPVTKVQIVGFKVPFWQECLDLAKNAALEHPQNRSIGWDIVVTENGPGLIEGNHDWCKLVWQLPVKKGLKPILEKHLTEYKN